ncbi:MAG: phenylacetate--CoA ligase, partial [Cypionkella sp.]|nr:phenylacetate--CoA ligase [Cypionkella sp.]
YPGLAPHFQIELRRDGRLDSMRVLVEAVAAADATELARLGAGLHKRIRQMWGINVEVFAGQPGSAPRSEGKAVRIVDLRPKI